jgi:hypothetical protein
LGRTGGSCHRWAPGVVASDVVPSCTVTVPVAIAHEALGGVRWAVDELVRSCAEVAPAEIIVWCNALQSFDERGLAARRFVRLVRMLGERHYESVGVFVRPAIHFIDPNLNLEPVGRMKHVRSTYMDVVAAEADVRGFPEEHPVLWFDADTTFMARDTVPIMVTALAERRAHIVKGNMIFTGDREDCRQVSDRDPHERVAIIYSVTRALLDNAMGPYAERTYLDECGLAFRLCDFRAAGGLTEPAFGALNGEGRSLLGNARRHLDRGIPIVWYSKEACHGTSYRRIQALAFRLPASVIPERESGEFYVPRSGYVGRPAVSAGYRVTESEVTAMVRRMVTRQAVHIGRPPLSVSQLAIVAELVRACGFGVDGLPGDLSGQLVDSVP